MKALTYTETNCVLTTDSSETITLPFNIRKTPDKSLFGFSRHQQVRMHNICPNLTSLQANIGGLLYRQKASSPVINPAECYDAYRQAHK
jgi:hypothetical protein